MSESERRLHDLILDLDIAKDLLSDALWCLKENELRHPVFKDFNYLHWAEKVRTLLEFNDAMQQGQAGQVPAEEAQEGEEG